MAGEHGGLPLMIEVLQDPENQKQVHDQLHNLIWGIFQLVQQKDLLQQVREERNAAPPPPPAAINHHNDEQQEKGQEGDPQEQDEVGSHTNAAQRRTQRAGEMDVPRDKIETAEGQVAQNEQPRF
ncbi:hypothetical protein U1Q18_029494 [Sarracenia purpurea var. burkii]